MELNTNRIKNEIAMTQHPFDALPLAEGGTLLFTPCPGTKDVAVFEAVSQLKDAGAQAIITLMPNAELASVCADVLPAACQQLDLRWFHLPIEDDAAPSKAFNVAWLASRESIQQILTSGGTIAVHCKGGSGRTGLMVAIILLDRGVPFHIATEQVQGLRPKSLKIPAHIEYLKQHNAL